MSGLEIVGAIASVTQLAGAVYSISIQLYDVANALSNAPGDIKDLAHDLEIFSEELLLHSKLVNANNHRYCNQVNRLTATIIGRCAIICEKIDKLEEITEWDCLSTIEMDLQRERDSEVVGKVERFEVELDGYFEPSQNSEG